MWQVINDYTQISSNSNSSTHLLGYLDRGDATQYSLLGRSGSSYTHKIDWMAVSRMCFSRWIFIIIHPFWYFVVWTWRIRSNSFFGCAQNEMEFGRVYGARALVCVSVWVQEYFFDDRQWCLLPVATTCNIWRHFDQNMNLMNFVFLLHGRVSSERRVHESQRRADDYYQKWSYQNLIKWMHERAPRKHAHTYLFWIKCNAKCGIDSHTQLRARTKNTKSFDRVLCPEKLVPQMYYISFFLSLFLPFFGVSGIYGFVPWAKLNRFWLD